MYKISRRAAVVLCGVACAIAATVTVGEIWKIRTAPNKPSIAIANIAIAKDPTPQWEFQSTKDTITDEVYASIDLYGEARSALLGVRCEKMVEIDGINVPIYTLQIATSDFLGRTHSDTRSVTYRLGTEHAVYEQWIYCDRNAEQVHPLLLLSKARASEILKRISLVREIIAGETLKIRVRTYKYNDLDFTFEGRDPTDANEKLIQACLKRTLDKWGAVDKL